MKSREQGAITTFNGSYAFVRPDGADKDVFAHVSELPTDRMYSGARVSFGVSPDPFKPGRMRAVVVRFIDPSEKP
jgi:cold shock CspA family protein